MPEVCMVECVEILTAVYVCLGAVGQNVEVVSVQQPPPPPPAPPPPAIVLAYFCNYTSLLEPLSCLQPVSEDTAFICSLSHLRCCDGDTLGLPHEACQCS